jgi:hypothetical protein
MFRFVAIALVFALFAGSFAFVDGRQVTAASAACPPNPSPPNPADPSMILNQPIAGATVTSPVHLAGFARVFEAHVDIQILSASGAVLVETFTMSAEAGPTLAPFSADVPFTVLTPQAGCIRAFAYSPADGTPRSIVQVEVNLSPGTAPTPAAPATPGPITPPSTGSGGLADAEARTFVPFVLAGALLTAVVCVRLRRGGIRP